MTNNRRYLEVRFAPEHYNRVCMATIPEGWDVVEVSSGRVVTSGYTKAEAEQAAKEMGVLLGAR